MFAFFWGGGTCPLPCPPSPTYMDVSLTRGRQRFRGSVYVIAVAERTDFFKDLFASVCIIPLIATWTKTK